MIIRARIPAASINPRSRDYCEQIFAFSPLLPVMVMPAVAAAAAAGASGGSNGGERNGRRPSNFTLIDSFSRM